jgi:ABC-type polysaccharide/polyol phosphate export permease
MKAEVLSHLRTGWALAGNNIRLQTRKHLLGYSWAIFTPVIYAACFLIVKRGLSGGQEADADHLVSVLRAFIGVTLLQMWFQLLQETSGLIRQRKSLLRGMNISEFPLVLAVLFEAAFGLLLRVLTIALAIVFLGLPFPPTAMAWLWIAVALVCLPLTAAAIGLFLAPWSALYPDVGKAISTLNLPLLLLSPVFYAATTHTDTLLFWINCINPLASPLATLMDALAGRDPLYWPALLVWVLLSLVLLLTSLRQLKAQVPILLERLGA